MNDFIQKLLDDIHNINPELALKRQTEYNQNFVNKALNEQCDIHVVVKQSELFECRNVACREMTNRDNGTVFCDKHKPYLGI